MPLTASLLYTCSLLLSWSSVECAQQFIILCQRIRSCIKNSSGSMCCILNLYVLTDQTSLYNRGGHFARKCIPAQFGTCESRIMNLLEAFMAPFSSLSTCIFAVRLERDLKKQCIEWLFPDSFGLFSDIHLTFKGSSVV